MPVPSIQGLFFTDFKNSYIPQILEEIYIKKVYQKHLVGKSDLIIADFGANIGLASYYFKDYASMVYAVEPAQTHAYTLQKMVEFNKIKNIKLCQYAIAGTNGKVKFYHPDNVTMYSKENVMGAKDFEEVETVTVKEFMLRNKLDHIDLLKLDVEGSEGEVITSPEFIEASPNIKIICGEWHNWSSMSKDNFCNTFRDLGYQFTWLDKSPHDADVFNAVRV